MAPASSTPAPLATDPSVVSVLANDLVWDPYSKRLYASLPSVNGPGGNVIVAIDPVTGNQVASQFAGSEPNRLSVSDDGKYLYAGIDGAASVSRFLLPGLTPDITFSLGRNAPSGPNVALDLGVAPGAPQTLAVTAGNPGTIPRSISGITIFDNATARALVDTTQGYDTLEWGKDASELFAADTSASGELYRFGVTAAGLRRTATYDDKVSGPDARLHYEPVSARLYGDQGRVVDAKTGQVAGSFGGFQGPSVGVPDVANNTVSFLTGGVAYHAPTTLSVYDATTFALKSQLKYTNTSEQHVTHAVRWGASGLAYTTDTDFLYITGSQGSKQGTFPTLPQTTANVVQVPLAAVEMVWDSRRNLLYATVPASAPQNANAVVAIDVASGSVRTVAGGSDPHQLALSDDGQFLYVGYDGSSTITRYALPGFTVSGTLSLGQDSSYKKPLYALDIQPVPNTPKSFAVSIGVTGISSPSRGIAVYDDTTARPNGVQSRSTGGDYYDGLQFSADGTKLFALDQETTGHTLYRFTVTTAGLSADTRYPGALPTQDFNTSLHLDKSSGLIYFDDGYTAKPDDGQPFGLYNYTSANAGAILPDATNNKAFGLLPASGGYFLVAHDLKRFTPTSYITLSGGTSNGGGGEIRLPIMVRYGGNGLAVLTPTAISLVTGTFVH